MVRQRLPEIGAERSQVEQIAALRSGWRESFRRLERYEKGREGRASLNLCLGDRREQDYRREQDKPVDHGDLNGSGAGGSVSTRAKVFVSLGSDPSQ